MLAAEIIVLLMFVSVCGLLMLGFPVAFTLAGTALLFGLGGELFGGFDLRFVAALPNRIFGVAMWNEVLIAVPLFVFMGVMLERSRVAEDLLDTMAQLFGRVRGGLGISVTVVGALLAASTGIVGATVVTMGLLSLPTMLKRGYAPPLACGSICAAGTLGQIIPPSIVLVILGDQISNAYVDAQREIGNWSPEPVSVGDLFAGALLPGLLLVGLYIFYQSMVALLRPDVAPAVLFEREAEGTSLMMKVGRVLVPPVVLIVAVLGSILAGVATPTEAASVGAMGAVLLAGLRCAPVEGGALGWRLVGSSRSLCGAGAALVVMLVLANGFDLRMQRHEVPLWDRIAFGVACVCGAVLVLGVAGALLRIHKMGILKPVMGSTMEISSMVFVILIGAALFSLVFRGYGGDDIVHELLHDLPGGAFGALFVVMLVMFILGFFLDFIEITFVVVPIVAPALLQLEGISPVWLGVMMALNLQTSFLTPPFGFALFYLRGVAPPEVSTLSIYRGVMPFVGIQLVALGLLAAWPELATWLPEVIFGSVY